MYDLVIRNGQIVDGSGQPSFMGDIAIHGERIVKIGLVEEAGNKEIDAEVEYQDHESDTIYAAFPIKKNLNIFIILFL